MKHLLFILIFIKLWFCIKAQDTATFTFSGVAEAYFSVNTNNKDKLKPGFVYSHNNLQKLNMNFAFAKLNVAQNKYRANLAAMAGTYVTNNLAAEPDWAKYIFEANAGVKISKQHRLWLDAGIMPSYIGFESANSRDCYTLTRSMIADNSPYYKTGIKLSYTNKKENITAAFFLLNGWQRIARPISYKGLHIGGQLSYKPTAKSTLNYSNYFGGEFANTFRTYHNFYYTNEKHKKINYILGVDVGTEGGKLWLGTSAIGKLILTDRWKLISRVEWFKDPNNVLYSTYNPFASSVVGGSIGADYTLLKRCLLRVEWKTLIGDKTYIYPAPDRVLHNITLSASVGF